ncbi:MAG: hypothetical protein ISS52_01640 [Dehalococcoidia bacterium]|nr:hypothetical protein [Dehalococcoidia bacterium]
MANNSKVHIKHEQLEHGITVNVFGDSAEEAMELLVDTINCIDGNTARDVARVDAAKPAPAQRRNPQPAQAPRPTGNAAAVNLPVCKQCGSSDNLDKVQFTNQDTGQLMTRFKCQVCRIWVGKAF